MAEQLGFTIRQRNVHPLDFILSLIAALGGDGNSDTQADLHRKFNELTGLNVTYRSWANQAKKGALPALCNADPSAAIADYLQRWQIETMFQALKGRGFNMEETHLRDRDKLSKLLSVLVLAFCWSYKTGEYVNEEHPIKIKTHRRKAQTLFRAGLDHLQRILDHFETWLYEFVRILSLFFKPRLSKAL